MSEEIVNDNKIEWVINCWRHFHTDWHRGTNTHSLNRSHTWTHVYGYSRTRIAIAQAIKLNEHNYYSNQIKRVQNICTINRDHRRRLARKNEEGGKKLHTLVSCMHCSWCSLFCSFLYHHLFLLLPRSRRFCWISHLHYSFVEHTTHIHIHLFQKAKTTNVDEIKQNKKKDESMSRHFRSVCRPYWKK